MRNRFVIAGLLLAAGLSVGPIAEQARAQPTAWDVGGRETQPLWAPVGTYQHDGSGIYFGVEGMYMHSPRALGSQTIAVRGVFFNIGSPGLPTTSPPNGTGVPMIEQGSFLGDRTLALDTSSFGPTAWSAGDRVTLGYRLENGWNFSISWLHLFGVKYSGAAGMLGPDMLNPGEFNANSFLFSPVYNFSMDFVGRNPFPNPPFTGNPTLGIWNGASDMTILFTQRFDNWDIAGKFPVFETENARSYAIAGGRFSWIWERFEWRTVKPTLDITSNGEFGFLPTADSTARYINTLSQRMYGPMIGVGHEVMLYSGPGGSFGLGTELTAAALLNIEKERAKYIREDRGTQAKRTWDELGLVPNVDWTINMTWQPVDGVTFRAGYNIFTYFNTKYMEEPVSFNVGAIDPAYMKQFLRVMHGVNFGVAFVF
jgi:hypothetical protein